MGTFRPQQRKNKFYNEVPFADTNAQGGPRVPMFMPKTLTTNNTASNGHVTFSPGVNPHAVHIVPGIGPGGGVMSQQGSSDCTSPFLNQSKITDSSTLQLTGQSNGADPDYYQELYNSSPSTLPIYHQIQGQPGQQQQQQVQPQMCCYNTTAQQSRPRTNQQQ